MKYKTFKVRGNNRYMRDGKLIKESEVPSQILRILQNVPTYDDDIPEPVIDKVCIFCGKPTLLTRFLNLRTIYICQEHYENKTVGETVKQAKEIYA